MEKISLDYSKIFNFISQDELNQMKVLVDEVSEKLHNKSGAGNDFLGWLDLPINYDKEEFSRIKKASDKIKADSEVLVVIGIGGSYLGARAVIECLSHTFFNSLNKEKRNAPEIYFAGQNISGRYLKDLIEIIKDRDFSVNVISKSGTTTEPAIAFRVFKKLLEEKNIEYSIKENENSWSFDLPNKINIKGRVTKLKNHDEILKKFSSQTINLQIDLEEYNLLSNTQYAGRVVKEKAKGVGEGILFVAVLPVAFVIGIITLPAWIYGATH